MSRSKVGEDLDQMMCEFDDLYKLDFWEEANEFIQTFDNTDSLELLIGVLTMTGPNMVGPEKFKLLTNRKILLDMVYKRLENENLDTKNILRGLI